MCVCMPSVEVFVCQTYHKHDPEENSFGFASDLLCQVVSELVFLRLDVQVLKDLVQDVSFVGIRVL